MASADQIKALVKSFLDSDENRFLTVALQMADREDRLGHTKFAGELRSLVRSKKEQDTPATSRLAKFSAIKRSTSHDTNRVDLGSLLHLTHADTKLSEIVLNPLIQSKIEKTILEHRQYAELLKYGLSPTRKILLTGPPGTGKTLSAKVLATELRLPLYTLQFDGLISRYLGETAAKLRAVFDKISTSRAVYLFDEFDAIGAHRDSSNDVGEVRRVLNSFLKFFEDDDSESLIVCATNHPELLDKALFRRFDDIVEFQKPSKEEAARFILNRLVQFRLSKSKIRDTYKYVENLSYADLGQACDEAAKDAVLYRKGEMTIDLLIGALASRVI
ncbi:SpoVK/Ycf46/Vps4 family AAA+-type ATPase [Zhongshania antarctica]|uniref:SpoVK/Ycf46/Vps4 family AAA+-type ATPase n=1 Tax=Zhongshania antarctica TaxID=641702 RepID=A0A840QZI6_9GAMM|nr:ATP-binding protein [Zhongshania antarctica]MBB5185744.1 SpoVK/Ycf46/Vps4 family AAA+-type ATPase [Zhongshania antarctica]